MNNQEMPRKIKFIVDDEESITSPQKATEITFIQANKLIPFSAHPFKLYTQEKQVEMLDSIKRNCILTPIIVRKKDNEIYEILSGHNRVNCAKILNIEKVPCIIKKASDDEAILIMIDTNLNQREKLLPSEKARAYKIKFDTIRHNDLNTENATGAIDTQKNTIQ